MKHSELKKSDLVIFKIYNRIQEKEDFESGNVIYIQDDQKSVCIAYLEGYRSETADVPYEKVLAVYDENGERMKFGHISGPSQLLEL